MTSENNATIRRRQDREAMNARDAQAWQLQRQGWTVRAIARELGTPPSSVQRCLQRVQKREQLADAMASGSPGDVVAVIDDELEAEDVTCAEDVERLNVLERYRLQHVPGEFGDAERARIARLPAGVDWYSGEPIPPTVYPIRDRDDRSWRDRCDAAMAGHDVDADGTDGW